MHLNKDLKKPTKAIESIFEIEHRLRKEAIEIAKNFKHVKPTKYLLK